MDWFYDFASPLLDAIGWLLAAFYSVIPNLGVAIILLTFTIMLLLYPLTAKQAKSMMAMQRVQPEVKKLQAKYKGDRQKLNEEMMKFYQENKINPLAGCLPLLAQLPIFIALFGVLRDPHKYVPTDSSLYEALCSRGEGVIRTVEACADKVNHLSFLGMDLQLSATDTHDGILDAAPYFILVGLVMLTGFMQTRQAQKRTPAANKQMGMVMKVLPVFFGLISLSFPAGLVLYFFVSNLWRLGQQEVIFRRHGMGSPTATGGAKPKAVKGGTKAAVIEADSRVLDDEDLDGADGAEDEAPRPIMPAKPKPAAQAESTAPTSEAPKKSGGLRSLFQMPPPPEPNGGGAAPARPRPSTGSGGGSTGGSGGGQPRPPQQRRRSKKKKRKR